MSRQVVADAAPELAAFGAGIVLAILRQAEAELYRAKEAGRDLG